jgi:hypothetical protein
METRLTFGLGQILAVKFLLALACFLLWPEVSEAGGDGQLPLEATLNDDAGRGNFIFIDVRLAGGEKLPCIIDTGTPVTILDDSIESQLGQRLGTREFWNSGRQSQIGKFHAIKLLLNGTELKTPDHLYCGNLKELSAAARQPVMGIIGMDTLANYCIQLDCGARKIRFMPPGSMKTNDLGNPFRMKLGGGYPYLRDTPIIGGKGGDLLIDTGCCFDGELAPSVFRHLSGNQPIHDEHSVIQRQQVMSLPGCSWHGQVYSNLVFASGTSSVGARFLARHLVTFDFKNRLLYLKVKEEGPLAGDRFVATESEVQATAHTAMEFLENLKATGRLRGFQEGEKGESQVNFVFDYRDLYPEFAVFDIKKLNAPSINYHYVLIRKAASESWRLNEVWTNTIAKEIK